MLEICIESTNESTNKSTFESTIESTEIEPTNESLFVCLKNLFYLF